MGMKLDAPVATNALDSSGEILSIKGLDITDFLEGRAVANWEHSNTSEDGAVGRFIYAKKIFSQADCENERQLSFWKQLQHEFLYGVVELYDDEGHPGAVSIAAMARYFIKRKEKIRIGMSIEGSTLDRDGHLLNRAVARKAAITLTPCNKECWIEYAGDEMPVQKSESVEVIDFEFESYDGLMEEIAKMGAALKVAEPNHTNEFFNKPEVKDKLHQEIQNMNYEAQNSAQGKRSGFTNDSGENVNTSNKSTFPEFYSKMGVKNKAHFEQVMNSKKGPVYGRMIEHAHDRLMNGYSNAHGKDMPDPKYLIHAVQHGLIPVQDFKEKMQEIDNYHQSKVAKSELVKNYDVAPKKSLPHPHSYDWHDDESLLKDDKGFVHSEAHGPVVNEQAGNVTPESFKNVMSNYGTVKGAGQPTNLKFYPQAGEAKAQVNSLVQQHGYTPYYAGGKHGKPDLANKNYTNKHLMIYDPTAGSGGDFGHEDYTDAWRKTHELAHGLTHEAVNNIYGEGRRQGKLGTRSPREMKRALHWEWLAAHKQRDLMGQLGHKIPDEDFHKELNTIMGDATHRAITGKFTEPSEMGFEPHSHKIPLEHSLSAIDIHAKKLGLQHEDDTLMGKSELNKNYDVAPCQLTGQSALTREDISGRTVHNTLKAVLRDWDKKKPLKDMVKAALPQLTDSFVDHFTQVAQEMALKKSEALLPQNIIPFSPIVSEQQQSLLNGLSIPDTQSPFEINANGQKVILRQEGKGELQASYSFLMDRYFGLGEFFPISNHFTYKDKPFTAELIVEGSVIKPKEQFQQSIEKMKDSGLIYKLHLADLILGKFSPRTNMSLLFSTDAPVCTYTNDILTYDLSKLRPMNDLMSDMIPLDIIQWLESKNPNYLKLQMSLLGLSRNQINEAIRVKSIIEMNRHQTIGQILEAISGTNLS